MERFGQFAQEIRIDRLVARPRGHDIQLLSKVHSARKSELGRPALGKFKSKGVRCGEDGPAISVASL